MPAERDATFKQSKPPFRFVPLAERVCADLAALYSREPRRVFDGPGVLKDDRERLHQAYRDIDSAIDRGTFFQCASRFAMGQRSQILALTPDEFGMGPLTPESFSPWQVATPEFADANEENLAKALRVIIMVPVDHEPTIDGTITWGRRVYTQTEAWLEDEAGEFVRPIYAQAPDAPPAADGGPSRWHTFGRIPLVGVRTTSAQSPGLWFPPIDDAMLWAAVELNLELGDMANKGRHAIGQEFLEGKGAMATEDAIGRTVEGTLVLPPETTYGRLEADPPIDKQLAVGLAYLELFAAGRRVSMATLMSSKALTGAAMQWEFQDQAEAREEEEARWRGVESEWLWLVAATYNRTPDLSIPAMPENATVRVDYRLPQPRENNLQTVQADEIRYSRGRGSPVLDLALEEGLTREEANVAARVNIRERLELEKFEADLRAEMGLAAPASVAGMNRTAEAIRTSSTTRDTGRPPSELGGE
jgi:hypothetical protein